MLTSQRNYKCLLQAPPRPRPLPQKKQKKASNNIFLENLKTTFQSLRNNNKVCLNVGDFKYDILKYEHNSVINEFLNLL